MQLVVPFGDKVSLALGAMELRLASVQLHVDFKLLGIAARSAADVAAVIVSFSHVTLHVDFQPVRLQEGSATQFAHY